MKKNAVIAFLVSLLLFIAPCVSAADLAGDESSRLTSKEISVMREQSSALDSAVSIKESVDENDYGGMYIDENNNLIVFVLSNNNNAESAVFANSSNKVTYKQADYSLKALTDEMDRIYDYMDENDIDCEMSLDESANRINISLPNPDILNDIATDMNMFDITVKENEYRRVKCASYTVNPGSTADTKSNSF